MGKLAERLANPTRAGIYRIETTDAVEEAAALNGYALLRLRLDTRGAMRALERFATENAPGDRVALVSGFEHQFLGDSAQRDTLLAALTAAAAAWRARGLRVFVVFLDPACALLSLAPLYHWHKSRT